MELTKEQQQIKMIEKEFAKLYADFQELKARANAVIEHINNKRVK